jgi:hypothetical protein
MAVVTSLCFYVKQFNINFRKNRTTFTAMFNEEHASQNELLLEKEMSYTSICVHEIMQPTRYTNSWNTLKHICYLTSTCFSPLRPSSGVEVLVKVKLTLEQATKAQGRRRGIALLFL